MTSDDVSDPRYRILVDMLDEGFVFQDQDARVVFANPAAARILGLTTDQMYGLTSYDPAWNATFEDGTRDPSRHPAVVAFQTGESVTNVAMRVAHVDGRVAWVSVNARPVFDDGATRPSGVVVSFRDVSEQVAAAAALRDERDHGRALVAALQDGLIESDRDGRITNVTDRFCEMTGFTRAELLGLTPPFPFWPEPLFSTYSAALAASPSEGTWDIQLARRDGSTFPALLTVSEVLDADGALQSILGVVRDMTERNETEARFRLLAENSTDLITCHDAELRCTYASPASRHIVGFEPEELIGERLPTFWHPEDRPRLEELADSALAEGGGEVPTAEYRVLRKDGSYTWLESSIRVVRDESGAVTEFQSRSRDVTARREAERALREAALERQQREADAERHRLEAELARAQRLESLGRLAGGIAHDFNNLLGVILNYASFVTKQVEPGSALAEDVLEIRRAAERATELTKQLLLFGRREVVRAEMLDLAKVVEVAMTLCRRSLGEVDLRLDLPTGRTAVHADRGQLEQVLMNLLLNARDAHPTSIVVTVERQADRVALTVADDGEGMSPETIDQAFEPFFTTKSRDQGSGLGLASVHGIITSAGGNVSIQSEVGAGTRVTIELPAGAEAPVEPGALDGQLPSTALPTVLVVDDEPEVRVMTARILREHGLRVVEAHSGREALIRAREEGSRPALLLSDVVMSGISGVELAGVFQALHPDVELLLMSGYAHDEVDGTNDIPLLMKPFSEAELISAVRRALDRRGVASIS